MWLPTDLPKEQSAFEALRLHYWKAWDIVFNVKNDEYTVHVCGFQVDGPHWGANKLTATAATVFIKYRDSIDKAARVLHTHHVQSVLTRAERSKQEHKELNSGGCPCYGTYPIPLAHDGYSFTPKGCHK